MGAEEVKDAGNETAEQEGERRGGGEDEDPGDAPLHCTEEADRDDGKNDDAHDDDDWFQCNDESYQDTSATATGGHCKDAENSLHSVEVYAPPPAATTATSMPAATEGDNNSNGDGDSDKDEYEYVYISSGRECANASFGCFSSTADTNNTDVAEHHSSLGTAYERTQRNSTNISTSFSASDADGNIANEEGKLGGRGCNIYYV